MKFFHLPSLINKMDYIQKEIELKTDIDNMKLIQILKYKQQPKLSRPRRNFNNWFTILKARARRVLSTSKNGGLQ